MLTICLCISIFSLGLSFHACCLPFTKIQKDLENQKFKLQGQGRILQEQLHRIERLFKNEAVDRILIGTVASGKVNKKDFEAEMSKKANKDEIQQHVRAYLQQEGN